jgi:hypothetical protein
MGNAQGSITARQIERELAADLGSARQECERVAKELNHAVRAVETSGIEPPDGLVLIEKAGAELRLAYEHYREALQRFTEFVIQGKAPESSGQASEQESAAGV